MNIQILNLLLWVLEKATNNIEGKPTNKRYEVKL